MDKGSLSVRSGQSVTPTPGMPAADEGMHSKVALPALVPGGEIGQSRLVPGRERHVGQQKTGDMNPLRVVPQRSATCNLLQIVN